MKPELLRLTRVQIMFVVVWKFEIAEEKVAGFEAAYASDGSWAMLFRQSPSYLGTELLLDAYVAGERYDWVDNAARHDLTRGYKQRNFWVMETQPGFVNWRPTNVATAGRRARTPSRRTTSTR